ncbi:MAG: histidinol-phosphatase HisJ family protein [Firmicutes bacterium]|nr:histidinol-phosphatase HisJ family protein [Bacillota bacterium]
MFDYHMHSTVSCDGKSSALEMALAAKRAGLREICFTDHIDHEVEGLDERWVFSLADYARAYDALEIPGLKIRRGMEFGISEHNAEQLRADSVAREYDFIIGSVHCVQGLDVYWPEFWAGRRVEEVYRSYLEQTLRAVRAQDGFDVLGHLTYICKCTGNPTKAPLLYREHREIVDEILRTLACKGIGLEINTSGIGKCGFYLPTADYLRRFRELGGEIVTVGSDAHHASRVGEYTREAAALALEIFGHVCTFSARKPIFHRRLQEAL